MTALDRTIRGLAPAYFSMVMATGIVSIAVNVEGLHRLSAVLMWVAGIAYVVLILLNAVRLVRYRHAVATDLRIPQRTFGFFTLVAATGVLGARLVQDGYLTAASILLVVTALLWLVLGYALPPLAFTAREGMSQLERADGTWFLWVVATQSVAVLAAAIQPHVTVGQAELALLAVLCWAVGVFLYVAVALFVASRIFMHHPAPDQLGGAYWIAMGATAITVVAGANIGAMADVPVLSTVRGTIEAGSVLFWAFGTWLIPPLVFAGYWRHVRHRVPLRYDVSLWAIVFPLAMYGVGCHQIGSVNDLPLLENLGLVEIWIAIVAWVLTFCGFVASLVGRRPRLMPRRAPSRP
ncbi:tellurite resistance/C4-dicarboxylate transporter family protein [Gordonia neofelifaecis]|uniref:C4-dicarboxylate transporter/malic acid transport protein n=1 Tax=Gordonia neofelifaecis NRRL B-59395 TaxID=644548 RepID=F1YKU6_9ACTN|nr:tellurite resistance/C4-dicarboxylate transporter family protein [Gordonia neofelifaecis]EGD54740.1 C4-dicarboxylate transporter/malic acid transport protein [Gordonia neofelifaecis NRRL B-59395]